MLKFQMNGSYLPTKKQKNCEFCTERHVEHGRNFFVTSYFTFSHCSTRDAFRFSISTPIRYFDFSLLCENKMVACSNTLVWEIIKDNNSFLKKVNGRSKRSGTMRFSVEKNNLRSVSALKHSGIANSKAVGIACTEDNSIVLSTKTASKSDTKSASSTIPVKKDFKRAVKTITSQVTDNFYRPDLTSDALAKYSVAYQANRRAKGIKKSVPVKRGRGNLN